LIQLIVSFTSFLSGCGPVESKPPETHRDLAAKEPAVARAPGRQNPVFRSDVSPLFEKYCAQCHDGAAAEGKVDLSAISGDLTSPANHELLTRVANILQSGTMPPSGEPRPTRDELETINAWLDMVLVPDGRQERHSRVRRLNRAEYDNSIRDLFGLDLRPARAFPDDDVGYGFNNIGDVLAIPPLLMEMYLRAAEEVVDQAFRSHDVRARLLTPAPDTVPRIFRQYQPPTQSQRLDKSLRPHITAPDQELARQQEIYNLLLAFCDRAFRRPATHDEITRLLALALAAESDGESAEGALRHALQAVLVSPQFLFLELEKGSEPGPGVLDLSDFALASRLSYFLWSSIPDEELFRAAAQGSLHKQSTYHVQVRRMLRDHKARALAENFACQWLQIDKLDRCTPDPSRYSEFDPALRSAMREETAHFFDAIRDQDRSLLDFLDANYTYVNDRLARHYQMEGVRGDWFRRVVLSDAKRGGVVTQASVLVSTSNPDRTSPVKRGKWILENILGAPPAPPPSGVEALKPSPVEGHPDTLRERMEAHRALPSCAGCHRRMDPLGFALENFDAIGAWRDDEHGKPIDAAGTLPDGSSFAGPAQLKAALVARRDAFARCLAEKMLTYALGRGLDRRDRRAVDQIVENLARADYRFSALVFAIVESEPFRQSNNRRDH
jgi:hypothetical protein